MRGFNRYQVGLLAFPKFVVIMAHMIAAAGFLHILSDVEVHTLRDHNIEAKIISEVLKICKSLTCSLTRRRSPCPT